MSNDLRDPIAIVGHTRESVLQHARSHDLGREGRDWFGITTPKQTRGRRISKIELASGAHLNRDLNEILWALKPALVR
jgi:hypothetical protein